MKIYYNEGNNLFYFQENFEVMLCSDQGIWYRSIFKAEELEFYSHITNNDNMDIVFVCEVED